MRGRYSFTPTPPGLTGPAHNGHTEVVAALLKAGADPNARQTVGLGLLASGTPLAYATKNNHTEVVAALLKAGATPLETQ